MIYDFVTYINEDNQFFDSEGEESLGKVLLEHKENDFSETNRHEESDEPFDSPFIEDFDSIGANLEDLNPHLLDDSISDPIPHRHLEELTSEIIVPKSILIQPQLLDLGTLDGMYNNLEVPEILISDDRKLELKIWETNS